MWRENPFLTPTTTIQIGKRKPVGGIQRYSDTRDGLSDGGRGGIWRYSDNGDAAITEMD